MTMRQIMMKAPAWHSSGDQHGVGHGWCWSLSEWVSDARCTEQHIEGTPAVEITVCADAAAVTLLAQAQVLRQCHKCTP